jgi:hypothetical protein
VTPKPTRETRALPDSRTVPLIELFDIVVNARLRFSQLLRMTYRQMMAKKSRGRFTVLSVQ